MDRGSGVDARREDAEPPELSARIKPLPKKKDEESDNVKSTTVCISHHFNRYDYDARKHGLWITMYTSGRQAALHTFVHGEREGTCRKWDHNGIERLYAVYVNDKLHGPYVNKDAEGRVRIRSTCKEGRLDGVRKVYGPNGDLLSKIHYKMGKKHGLCEEYHAGRVLGRRSNYVDGELSGLHEEWDNHEKLVLSVIHMPRAPREELAPTEHVSPQSIADICKELDELNEGGCPDENQDFR